MTMATGLPYRAYCYLKWNDDAVAVVKLLADDNELSTKELSSITNLNLMKELLPILNRLYVCEVLSRKKLGNDTKKPTYWRISPSYLPAIRRFLSRQEVTE